MSYHLRHAAVSLWINAGVPATQVAKWAGHSVHVLLKVYAKCIDGQDEAARRRIEAALSSEYEERRSPGGSRRGYGTNELGRTTLPSGKRSRKLPKMV